MFVVSETEYTMRYYVSVTIEGPAPGPKGLNTLNNTARSVRLLINATIIAKPVSKPK